MKARLLVAAIIVLTGLASGVLPVEAATRTVCPSGCAYSSIQEAIDASNSGDTINVQPGMYSFFTVNKNLTLSGASGAARANIIVHGDGSDSAVHVVSGVTTQVTGMTFTGGGGSIETNECDQVGGGVYNEGHLTLQNVVIMNNGVNGAFGCLFGRGGGIFNAGTLILSDSAVTDNSAGCDTFCTSDGGGILNEGTMTISNTGVRRNDAEEGGGGIWNSGTLTVTDNSYVTDNFSDGIDNGGTLTLSGSTVGHNSGGGIINQGKTTVTSSSIQNNSGIDGGGINNHGTLIVQKSSLIRGNTATIKRGNTNSGNGGGIYSTAGTVTVVNSVITQNAAERDGGGIWNSAALSLQSTRIIHNTAGGTGGGVMNSGGVVTQRSTTIRGNVPNNCVGC